MASCSAGESVEAAIVSTSLLPAILGAFAVGTGYRNDVANANPLTGIGHAKQTERNSPSPVVRTEAKYACRINSTRAIRHESSP